MIHVQNWKIYASHYDEDSTELGFELKKNNYITNNMENRCVIGCVTIILNVGLHVFSLILTTNRW